ncbi:MlaD family protein [Lewinella sp. W8]|uniref:MlaD family protein n=1 Tax=Lewinella sp. W8 TaxID=2528208 RepID=UPI0010675FC5|nr:MlaD family protein [Lewinella sp. W8]MTB50656.1 MCE family protein [Lewinella sp. W8]
MRSVLNYGLLVCLALVFVACSGNKTYYLNTSDAEGIRPGADVIRQGVIIGEVKDVDFDDDMVAIEVSVDEEVYEGQRFHLGRQDGETVVKFGPPNVKAEALPNGGTLREREVEGALLNGLGEVLEESLGAAFELDDEDRDQLFSERTGNRLERAFEGLGEMLEGLGESLEEWAEEHEETFEELEEKLEEWAEENEEEFEEFGREMEEWAEDFEGDMEDFGQELERISEKHEVGSNRWKKEVRKALRELKERN